MSNVLLIVLLILTVILTGLILIQRSEGGALGIGGGGGGFMSGRGATNAIQKATAILGTLFLVLSLVLSIVFNLENKDIRATDTTGETKGLIEGQESVDTDTPKADASDLSDAPETTDEATDPDAAVTTDDATTETAPEAGDDDAETTEETPPTPE